MAVHYPKCTTIALLEGAVTNVDLMNRLKKNTIIGCERILTTSNLNHMRSGTGNKNYTVYTHLRDVSKCKPNIGAAYNNRSCHCSGGSKDFCLVDACYGEVHIKSVIAWQ